MTTRTFILNELPNQTEVWREKLERGWKGEDELDERLALDAESR